MFTGRKLHPEVDISRFWMSGILFCSDVQHHEGGNSLKKRLITIYLSTADSIDQNAMQQHFLSLCCVFVFLPLAALSSVVRNTMTI